MEKKKESSSAESFPSAAPSAAPEDKPGEKKKELNIEELKKQRDEYLAGWQRARADFLNYKKEEMERFGEVIKHANQELILKILPILDNFEIAEKKIPEDLKNDENLKGFLQIKRQILDFLRNQSVEEIKSIGERFDPDFQEVVEEIEVKDKEPGMVIEEVQKGYTLHGKLIRPAKVKISK